MKTRHHTIWDASTQQQIDVPFTEEEEAARDAEEKEDKKVAAAQASAEAKQDILIQNIRSPQASLQDVLAIVREMVREA